MADQPAFDIVPGSLFEAEFSSAPRRSRIYKAVPLLLILAVALVVRGYWMTAHAVVITTEGADYARQGDNLLHGQGFRGLMGHQELLDPPGYAILIAGVTFLVRNSELATKIISLLLGLGLIFPIYLLCFRMYGRRTALLAAALVAVHPIFISLSSTAYSEGIYLPLVVAGIFCGIVAMESGKSLDAGVAGIFFACGYLTRQEAIPFLLVAGFWILIYGVLTRETLRQALIACLVMGLAFTLLAAPYVVYLSVHTGRLRIEAKNGINFLIAKKQMAGIPHRVAAFGIDDNLNVEGPMLDPNKFVGYSPSMSLSDFVRYARNSAFVNSHWLYFDTLLSIAFGSPFLLFLVVLGLFQKPWDASRVFREVFLLSMFAYVLVMLLLAHMYQARYTFILLPFLTIWAANGLSALIDWGTVTAATFRGGRSNARFVGMTIAGVTLASVAIASSRGVRTISEFAWSEPAYLPVKTAGLWLKDYQPGPKSIMADACAFPYYADGTQILFPVADAGLVLRYIEHKSPDFIVMYNHERWASPAIASWFDTGIPDPRARLVYDNGLTGEVAIRIYKWSPARTGIVVLQK
jgi:4-amino-4-deoxy-L-arabinose transferase-like glycosyltransferase